MLTASDIALAFTQQNDKKTWKARAANSANGLGEVVHFSTVNGMIAIDYHVDSGRFAVKFRKFQGAFGDYTKAIARGLFVILNTLKSAGLPFEGPPSLAGMVIEATTTDDNTVYVAYKGPPASPIMPEQRPLSDMSASALRYETKPNTALLSRLPNIL